MIRITSMDLKNYERIGAGKFGSVYKVSDEMAYKIYHPILYDYSGRMISNPALRLPRRHFERLRKIGKKLSYTDTFSDYIYVDGKFGGICIPYYNGDLLVNLMKEDFSLKRDISKQFIRNSRELNKYHIYPTDYKLNNAIFEDGELRIIDLDDNLTKASHFNNIFYKRACVRVLNETIYTFFNGYTYRPYTYETRMKLNRKKWENATTYSDIEKNLLEYEKPRDYLLMDSNSDFSYVKELLKNNDYRLMYVYDKKIFDDLYYTGIVDLLNSCGISLYDFICRVDISKLFSDFNVSNCYEVSGRTLVKRCIDKK